jgi:hypothetical protein
MPSPNSRPSAPLPCNPSLAGIIACLGLLAAEAQSIGEPLAAARLLEVAEMLRRGSLRSH